MNYFALFLSVLLVACTSKQITSYEECIEAGYPMMKSYPPQCSDGTSLFAQDLGNTRELADVIIISTPLPGTKVTRPLTISGEARGYWFFEASFPVVLRINDANEEVISFATAMGDWMTEDFVPFEAVIDTELPSSGLGTVILKKANASGDPSRDEELRIPIRF